MDAFSIFTKLRDYVESNKLLDDISSLLSEDDLYDICDFIKDKYEIDLSDEEDEYYNEDEY